MPLMREAARTEPVCQPLRQLHTAILLPARESARVDGKPRIVSQRYLGKAADIEAAIAGATGDAGPHAAISPSVMSLRCGRDARGASAWPRSSTRSSARGEPMPGPRSGPTSPWRRSTGSSTRARSSPSPSGGERPPATGGCGSRRARSITGASGRRWTRSARSDLERDRAAHRRGDGRDLRGRLSGLVLDMTNFATWIDSANDRAPIAQRGHSKQKRNDLRIVGLGLVVSVDGGDPARLPRLSGQQARRHPVRGDGERARRPLRVRSSRDGRRPADRLTWSTTPGRTPTDNYELLDGSPLSLRRVAPAV